MIQKKRTQIYNDRTFFGDYFDSTSEKQNFVDQLYQRIAQNKLDTLLDLGCFDGALTKMIVKQFRERSFNINSITGIEPSSIPLESFQQSISHDLLSKWTLKNQDMETYLTENTIQFDLVIASHSLYWMQNPNTLLSNIVRAARSGVLVIRDNGLLHQVEKKFRPLMLKGSNKKMYSSRELEQILNDQKIEFTKSSFQASMKIPPINSIQFMKLTGFLLDLTLDQIDETQLPALYESLCVQNGSSYYGIDLLWFGELKA